MKKTIKIANMTCSHCEMHVKNALENIDGVSNAKVSYKRGNATVKLTKDVTNDVLKKAVEDQDYLVIEIK